MSFLPALTYMSAFRLTQGPFVFIVAALVIIAGLIVFSGIIRKERAQRWRGVWSILIAAALVGLAAFVVEVLWNPSPEHTSVLVYLTIAVPVAAIVGLFLQPGRRIVLALALVLGLIGVAGTANIVYRQYETVRSLDPQPVTVSMSYSTFASTTRTPKLGGDKVGALVDVPLEGEHSNFPARTAKAYIPPAYWEHPESPLPVLVLMAGNPGSPDQWFGPGAAQYTADTYQREHGGFAPIIFSVDGTASLTGNPICVDGPQLKVMTYLSDDVPTQIKQKFRVALDQRTWTIGGLSYGGTCALQVITNRPAAYGNFLDFAGQAEPTLGDHDETVRTFFDGNEQAFQDHNPETLLGRAAQQTPPGFTGYNGRFFAGEDDHEPKEAMTHLNDLAQRAGMNTSLDIIPGGHTFQVWRPALEMTIDWVAKQGGINK